MAYDPLRKKVILFGGKFPNAGNAADLWEWEGQTWAQRPVKDIGIVSGHAITCHAALKWAIVHGTGGETRARDGNTLTQVP